MSDNPPLKKHVCIVGAGISGLRCADVLLSHGFEVTILEARYRIGGRICQSDELGYTVDIGPNRIHAYTDDSKEPHPIYALAQATNTPLHHWNSKRLIYDSDGNPLPEELSERLSTILWQIIGYAFTFSEDLHQESSSRDISCWDSLATSIRQLAAEMVADEKERELLLQMGEMFGAYVGVPVWRQSLRFAWMAECFGGEEMFVSSNFSSILQLTAKPALEGAHIRLNTLVTGVTTPPSTNSTERATIKTSSGETLKFDQIVMTTPLGWLKKHHSTVFSPPLPDRLASAIRSISLSSLEKVFITFPTVFWNPPLNANDASQEGGPKEFSLLHQLARTQLFPFHKPRSLASRDMRPLGLFTAKKPPDHFILPLRRLLPSRRQYDL